MTILLFANNANSTLAAGLPATGAGSTTIVLAAGTGALFPVPSGGAGFKLTLQDAATQTLEEIVLCTNVVTDTLTVIRAQEGTSARAWNVGDLASNFHTAGAMANAVQQDQLQLGTYEIAIVGGTANALTGTVASGLTALANGMRIRYPSQGTNTSAATFNLTLGATATGALPIITADTAISGGTTGLMGGTLPPLGYNTELTYSLILDSWVLTPIAPINLMPRAWAIFTAGTLGFSCNIATWTKASTGVYNFTFTNQLPTPNYGINFGANNAVTNATAALSNALATGGTINGFNTTSGAAQDIDGMITFWC